MYQILVSACLVGRPVRYDGSGKALSNPIWLKWQAQQRLLPICPEVVGGLATPRAAAERQPDGRIMTTEGADVTSQFHRGATLSLAQAIQSNVAFAVLKANSPSCGNQQVYDGNFAGRLIEGQGVTAALLSEAGFKVFNEHQLEQAEVYLEQLERV
ncbi:DUF523 domain-containing protein [Echinimonas agarilytica]|uniref:DUF523 domain-containing protein n=1 Tax=Echinimonas agarilytica TaxID=1215918 RepID=A0AA42B634_9GAMM|nr:DUF523 domain-containing protein [Echinimonas agarilytica]MCM2678189.1 DUF523 domain-containing protein [Echinimonas agarilytica]